MYVYFITKLLLQIKYCNILIGVECRNFILGTCLTKTVRHLRKLCGLFVLVKGANHVSLTWEAVTTKSGLPITYQLYEGICAVTCVFCALFETSADHLHLALAVTVEESWAVS